VVLGSLESGNVADPRLRATVESSRDKRPIQQTDLGRGMTEATRDESDVQGSGEAESTPEASESALEPVELAFDDHDRLPAVAQDADSGEVLMLAFVTPEAVERTHETGRAHYYSRSREELWEKGATSGHTQHVREIRVDCDGDALLYLVDQTGGACHTGYASCFHRTIDGDIVGERVFDPDEVYGDA
jgi:phosphoribosyl-AMP cyclohydrolase